VAIWDEKPTVAAFMDYAECLPVRPAGRANRPCCAPDTKQVANAKFDTAVAGCESPSYKHSDGAILETKGRPKLTLEFAPAKQIIHQRETVLTN